MIAIGSVVSTNGSEKAGRKTDLKSLVGDHRVSETAQKQKRPQVLRPLARGWIVG